MGNLFNMDNPFFRVLGKVMDLIILNLLCIVCCIPIITIGPSLTALFYVTLKMVRNEEGYIVKGFFKSFRQNLRQGILINVIMLAIGFFLYMDFRVLNLMENRHTILFFLMLFILLIYMMVFIYIYPVLAKFDNTIRNTFQNALMMSISHLPYTLLMLVVTIAPIALLIFTPSPQIQSLILMLIFMMGIAVIAYSNSYFFVKIFDKYIPAEEDSSDPFEELSILRETDGKELISSDLGTVSNGTAAPDGEADEANENLRKDDPQA